MANKKHSFVDEFLDVYFDFLKEYDNLDYSYTSDVKKEKNEILSNGKPKEAIEEKLRLVSSDKFHILYGFYTFLDDESNKITHLYQQFLDKKFIPVPISNEGLDGKFTDIFDEFHKNETLSFWNLPDAYRVNNWIFEGTTNYIHDFYKNTITQKLNSKSAYNIILSEEIIFFLYGKYYFEGKGVDDISGLLCLEQNYTSTTQITPNLKQLIKFACSVEAKVCVEKEKTLNNHFSLDYTLWNNEEGESKNREFIEKFIDDQLVLKDVKSFISEIHFLICKIIKQLIEKIDNEINQLKNEKFKTDYNSFFYNNGRLNYAKLWEKIARFNFDISEKLIQKDKTRPFHDILLFPILKASTGNFWTNTFFYKECINDKESVKIEVPFVMTCYITTLYGLDKSLLDEDEESLNGFNITMEVCKNFAKPIVDEIFYDKLINARIKPAATRAAISQVMARNTSHNIGAHVMNNLIDGKKLKNINIKEFDKYQSPNIKLSDDDSEIFSQIAYFNNYVKGRMDYLADITFGTPMMQTNRYAYSDLYLELDKVRLLLENISGLTKFKYQIQFKKNNKNLKENNDLLVAIPNDVLGMQAFYNILENIIRNTAKHSKKESETTIFTVNFIDEVTNEICNCDNEKEITHILNDLIAVEVYDNIPIIGEGRALKDDEKVEFKKIDDTKDKFDDKIEELVFNQNRRINADILEDGKKLRTSSLGVIEMDASAAYLRKRDVSLINHEHYNVEHDECWSCKSPNATQPDFEHGKVCRNFLKAFKAKLSDDKYALGYRFFLLRPEVVLVVIELEIKQKDALKKQGIWIVNKQDFEKHLKDGKVYNHEFVVYDQTETAITTLCEAYKTSLPLRILSVEQKNLKNAENDGLFDKIAKIEDKKEWLGIFEEYCWKEIENKLAVCEKEEKHIHFALHSSYVENSCFPIVLLDHLYEKDGQEKEFSNENTEWKEHNNKQYYVEALSSLAQFKMPNFQKIIETNCQNQDSLNEKFKYYLINLDKVSEQKLIESAVSKVVVIDERIQNVLQKDFMKITYQELYKRMNVFVPDTVEEIKQDKENVSQIKVDLGADSFNKETTKEIKKYVLEYLTKMSVNDYLLIHYSILERIYNNKIIINKILEKLALRTNIVVTSGRGIPEDLTSKVRFVNLSSIITAFVEIRSKYAINYLLSSSRKSKSK